MSVLLTGFPSRYLAKRVLAHILEADAEQRVVCVVQAKFQGAAEEHLALLPRKQRERVELLEGDAAALDFGLSGEEIRRLGKEIRWVHHCAAITYQGVPKKEAERMNIGAARELVEFAELAENLERVVFWSTASLGGNGETVFEDQAPSSRKRSGVSSIDRSRLRADALLHEALGQIPLTILRPSIIVGDSETGEIDRLDGPYLLAQLVLNSPQELRLPMPGRGDTPLNMVPIDYVVEAGCAIAKDPRSRGRVFHLVDPDPPTARRVFELIADVAGRPVPRGYVPAGFARAFLNAPGLERFAHLPRTLADQLTNPTRYDDRNAREVLDGTGITCPAFEDYVQVFVNYTQGQQTLKRAEDVAVELSEDDLPHA